MAGGADTCHMTSRGYETQPSVSWLGFMQLSFCLFFWPTSPKNRSVETIPIGGAHKTVRCAEVRLHDTLIKFNCESHQLAHRHLRLRRRLPARGGVTRQRPLGAFFTRPPVVRWEREIRVAWADLLPGR